MLNAVFDRFVDQSPVTVMVGGLLERVMTPEKLDAWFEQTAEEQYTRTLLFSTVFDLMSQVVCGIRPSLHAAYQANVAEVGVSIKSVYNKLNSLEAPTSSALVGYSATCLDPIVSQMGGTLPPAVPGYRLKIVDGNCLSATQHRLSELRVLSSGALPGKSLVVYDPARQMAIDAICCEDGHVQERALFDHLLTRVEANDVWMGGIGTSVRGRFCVASKPDPPISLSDIIRTCPGKRLAFSSNKGALRPGWSMSNASASATKTAFAIGGVASSSSWINPPARAIPKSSS